MACSVRRALELPELSGVEPVAGLRGLENTLRWVHVMSIPATSMVEWIRGGELLLSTGYLWPKTSEQQRSLVRSFSSAGLSALLLTVGKYFYEIPPPILEAADAADLPLLKGPWELKFVDVAEAVQKEIMGQQLSLISTSERIQRTLIEVTLRKPSLLELAESLAKLVENRVAIEDSSFRLVAVADATSTSGPGDSGRFHGIEDRVAREPGLAFRLQASSTPVQLRAADDDLQDAVVCPIRAEEELLGYLTILATNSPLSPLHLAAAEHGARVVALHMARNRTSPVSGSREESSFLVALLKGEVEDQTEAIARASFYGIALEKRHMVALLESRAEDRSLQARMRVLLAAEKLRPVVFSVGGRTAMLFEEPDTERGDLPEILSHLLDEEPGTLPVDARIAFSRAAPHLAGIATGYRQALAALQIGERLMPRQRFLRYDDLRVYRLLDAVGDRVALEEYVRQVLGPLARPKTRFERDLRLTIDVLVEKQFCQVEAARALYLHKNSMRYRLQRIEEATGLVLTRHDHSHQLQLAVEADRLLSASAGHLPAQASSAAGPVSDRASLGLS